MGAVAAVQPRVASRKSSHEVPWENRGQRSAVPLDSGGGQPIAPSTIAFADLTVPVEMTDADAARRNRTALGPYSVPTLARSFAVPSGASTGKWWLPRSTSRMSKRFP
jgi:hypothetical protein